MAKDDTNPNSTSEETVSAVGPADAVVETESPDAASASDGDHRARRGAPHLRVVGEDEEFTPPALPAADAPHQRIGAVLRSARENQGLSFEQISKETRISVSHLRAIEEMTPNIIGEPVYIIGHVKTYARHLKLDSDEVVARYKAECAILKDPKKQEIAPPATGRSLPVAVPVLGFLIVALVGAAAAFFFLNGDKTPAAAKSTAAAAAEPQQPGATFGTSVLAAPPATDPAAPAQQNLRIVTVKHALLEVRSARGDKYVRRYFEPGETFPVRNGAGWTVTTDDGSAFEWRLGDQSLGLVQAEGGPVYAQSADIAAKRAPVVLETAQPETTEATPAATAATPAPAGATTAPPAATGAAPAPAKPKVPRPRPEIQANAPVKPPVTAATPAVAPPAAAAAPPAAKDPALAAYPDQQPQQQQ